MKPTSFVKHFLSHKPASYIPAASAMPVHHNFAALENDFGISPFVAKAWRLLDPKFLTHYPDRNAKALKNAVAAWLAVKPSMIALGNGSDELISLIAQTFVEPEHAVVIQTPTFFRIIEAVHKVKGLVIEVAADRTIGFALDRDICRRIIDAANEHHASVIWLCTPDNPTGAVLDRKHIAWILTHTKALVVVDEAYQELCDPRNRQSAIHLLRSHKNLIVTRTFSKAFGLAGARVGMLIAQPEVIETIDAWRLNFPVSHVSLVLAEAALKDTRHLIRIQKMVAKERAWLFRAIRKLPDLEIGASSHTNVFLLRHKTKNIHALLLHEGILTADFNRMNGLEHMRFVRITVKQHKENLALISALTKFCRSGI
ncbi:MAG: aminotransferase class I/II-fold pyridoxal phosphate-dependent enzyme [Patescibacteria group bacterium]